MRNESPLRRRASASSKMPFSAPATARPRGDPVIDPLGHTSHRPGRGERSVGYGLMNLLDPACRPIKPSASTSPSAQMSLASM
jgi:hypothetical protein